MAEIVIDRVRKSYGPLTVLKDFSLHVADGEFVVLVGPSGCGKSTMLKILAGLEEATSGTIRIGGREVTDLAPGDRDIAMVFQNYALYPHLTVAANMGFGLKMRGTPAAEITAGCRRPRAFSMSSTCWNAARASSPAGSASAWHWDAPSCASRRPS